jgi:hypothetical protein
MDGSAQGPGAAWLVLAVGDDRQHGGNDGYDDVPEEHYSWDSTVPNHAAPAEGDAIVLWDKHSLLGASVIEHIQPGEQAKWRYSCPRCNKAGIKERRTYRRRSIARFKCYKCKSTFDEPDRREDTVKTYRSSHSVGWVDLAGVLDGSELRALCVSPESQLSLRPLRWADFSAAVEARGGSLDVVTFRAGRLTGGHRLASVRVRVGQARFRQRLLADTGAVCALTGPAPPAAPDACHLYSYAKVGEHHEHGGLLLRRDVHRLFDLGLLAVDPTTMRIDVDPALRDFPEYRSLAGRTMRSSHPDRVRRWLADHWKEHRVGPL